MRTSRGVNRPAYRAILAVSGPRLRSRLQPRHHPRHRAPRRRTGAAAVLVAVGLALVLSGPGGPTAPAFAATDQPTVEFVGGGPAPLACSSTPSVPNLTVKQNTRVVLANFTGADATANIGDGRTVPVADGKAISVKLKPGSYTVTMTPNCLDTYKVGATVITVVRSDPEPTPSPSRSPSAPAADSVGPPTAIPGPAGDASYDGPSAGPSSSSGPLAGGAPPSVGAVPGQGGSDSAEPDVRDALAPAGRGTDQRGDRLLGLIAAICVFGVTSAIIRAIVAQRAPGTLGM